MNNTMNSAVRKIHNLLSSGAVTVTVPSNTTPRILKQKVGASASTSNNVNASSRCYVCDDSLPAGQPQHQLTEMETLHSTTKFPNKIGQLVGDAFMVIVSVEDMVCARCTNLINYLDRLENDVDRVRTNLINLLQKKYGLNDEGGGGGVGTHSAVKMQKLNSGTSNRTVEDTSDSNRIRKVVQSSSANDSSVKPTPPVSAVQQIRLTTPSTPQQSAGTQTRKTAKIYKCLSCDYKTSDMRIFNTHYETCKHQNFQCKNCKKIFPNFGTMKQHMVREHNTAMDNTCAICHINFVNEPALRKHMEMNHSTNVVVASTTTLPGGASVAAAVAEPAVASVTPTQIYTCNQCPFKSTDKQAFEEHLRKHIPMPKPKPFKCRLCSQRFETREEATVHAKQHQPNYFKCGTCALSFPKRELLVKHFEVHQQQQPTTTAQQTTVQSAPPVQKHGHQQQGQSLNNIQKVLHESIDEAVNETPASNDENAGTGSTSANNIRFFSCHICSLTFIQENYYTQHMETHRREKKSSSARAVGSASSGSGLSSAATALLSEDFEVSAKRGIGGASSGARHSHSTTSSANISETDIESIFEKMHSDKGDTTVVSSDAVATSAAHTATTNTTSGPSSTQGGDNLVITSQEGTGGITFNITIPQPDVSGENIGRNSKVPTTTTAPVSVSIDMPMLDHSDEPASSGTARKTGVKPEKNRSDVGDVESTTTSVAAPVSMPSLDDDNDTHTADGAVKTEVKQEDNAKAGGEVKTEDRTSSIKVEVASESVTSSVTDGEHSTTTVHVGEGEAATSEQLAAAAEAAESDQQVTMELDEAMQAQVESGQIKFILNENGQLLQLDNHIITDAEGNQILVQDPEQIQQLLQSVGVLQSGDGLDGETLQMMTDANGQMVLVHGENNETQLIDASLLNAEGQLVIQQGQDGELGEGAHVIGEDGTRIPVSVSYTADGQPIVQVQQQVLESGEGAQHVVLEKDSAATAAGAEGAAQVADAAGNAPGGGFFALEELMQQSSEAKAAE